MPLYIEKLSINLKKVAQITRNAIYLSLNLKSPFILYINKESVEATILFCILALKIKLLRGFWIANLHYTENYQRKNLAMFYHQNEMIYEHFSGIPCKLFHDACLLWPERVITAASAVFVYIKRRGASWKIYSLYARKMLVNHLVLMVKHCKDFALIIICIMQVCNHKSSL